MIDCLRLVVLKHLYIHKGYLKNSKIKYDKTVSKAVEFCF